MKIHILLFTILLLLNFQLVESVSPYFILGLEEDASEKEVTQAYKKIIKKFKKNTREKEIYEAAYKEIMISNMINDNKNR